MKLYKLALVAAFACGIHAGNVHADQANDILLVGHHAAPCDCGQPVCGCETACCDTDCCDTDCCDSCCDSCGCGSGCALGGMLGGLGGLSLFDCDCNLGDPCRICDGHGDYSAGGWVQIGYHTAANTLFNSNPDEVQLHQAWLWAEKALDTSNGFGFGGRIDYVYGTDAPDTQAFGTDPRGWDNDWDHGNDYGHALPQVYGEIGYGDVSVKLGHFYTIIGYEVVQAPQNFFYSHAYTFYNSEPFTHTGAMATYNVGENITAWGGWTMGWDSGFDDNGDNYIGGASLAVTDNFTLTYGSVIGRFGEARFNGVEKGYMNSIIADVSLSDKLNYVFWTDYLSTEDAVGIDLRKTYDITQYLTYAVNDCLAIGGRFEWYNHRGIYDNTDNRDDIYALTTGVNYRPHANLVVRPEFRWDWDKGRINALEQNQANQFTFGMDTILTF